MEIEAKFVIASTQIFTELTNIRALGQYKVGSFQIRQLHDTYLDTPDGVLNQVRWVCRQRNDVHEHGNFTMTVKGPGRTKGAVHRREEYEFSLTGEVPPQEWPAGKARDEVLARIGTRSLIPFMALSQTRHIAPILREGLTVAEISVDEVIVEARKTQDHYYELEIEIREDGTETDLEALTEVMLTRWGLPPQPRSKFERALAFVRAANKLGR